MSYKCRKIMDEPEKFRLVDKVEKYTYIQESIMLATVAGYIASQRFGFKMI